MRLLVLLVFLSGAPGVGCGARVAPASPADDGRAEERTAYRRAVGGLGAGFLYQTHMVIGATADLLGRKAIGSEEVTALMETAEGMSQNVEEILTDVRKLPIGPADGKTVAAMLHVNRLLVAQARSLRAFAQAPNEENAERFESDRNQSWVRLSRLLNVPTHR